MAYTELIKSFERIRNYMREFYIYGFKSREELAEKSTRSYDNERRRIESYLGDYMAFRQTPSGKNIFISIDSRASTHNPLFKALKAKSFTSGDITLHFILFDILYTPKITMSLNEIMEKIDEDYLSYFSNPMIFDKSTVRKKLKEYEELGLVTINKEGRQVTYSRSSSFFDNLSLENNMCYSSLYTGARREGNYSSLADGGEEIYDDVVNKSEVPTVTTGEGSYSSLADAIGYFSEVSLCGVIGSYILDKLPEEGTAFSFKHHYITHALESEVLYRILLAIAEEKSVSLINYIRGGHKKKECCLVPLKIFVSVQSGRRYLIGYNLEEKNIRTYRLDYIAEVKLGEAIDSVKLIELKKELQDRQKHMWGVSFMRSEELEHVEFTIYVGENEGHISRRLEREKRCGTLEWLDDNHIKFSCDVYDSNEMLPWIRTFICRITSINFSNKLIEDKFKNDLEKMYSLYDIGGED